MPCATGIIFTEDVMRANDLMKHNIRALLKGRSQTQRDLAQWCRKSDAWIGKILKEERREFPMKYWDKIADFFGISVYQLIQPGISILTERRRGDRRSGQERRLRNVATLRHDTMPLARAIAQEVFTMDREDVATLAAQLALLKRRKISGSSTAGLLPPAPGADQSDDATGSDQKKPAKPQKKR